MSEKLLPTVIRGAIPLSIGAPRTDFRSGCATVDVSFPNSSIVDVGEIQFRNYYVAILTVRARLRGADGSDVWRTLVKNKRLMDDPHSERGSHDYVVLTRKNVAVEMENVSSFRFVLRQPSPVWKDFYLDDIKIYASVVETSNPITLTEFLKLEESAQRRPDKSKLANVVLPNVQAVSMELQQLWGLTELLKANQSTVGTGRYDIDGSYDINLLSYA